MPLDGVDPFLFIQLLWSCRPPSTFFVAQKKVLFRSEGEFINSGQRLDCLTPAGGACRTGLETTFPFYIAL